MEIDAQTLTVGEGWVSEATMELEGLGKRALLLVVLEDLQGEALSRIERAVQFWHAACT